MIGVVLFAERKNGRDRFFFPATEEETGIVAVCSFILQSAAKFELGGVWDRGWRVQVIDREDYEAAEKAEDAEINRLQGEISKIHQQADVRLKRDLAIWDKIEERLP